MRKSERKCRQERVGENERVQEVKKKERKGENKEGN